MICEWRADPVVFARQGLDVHYWSRQAEIARNVARHRKVACRSGHKIGKSTCAAGTSLWAAALHKATVILVSPEWQQIVENLYNPIRMLAERLPVGLGPVSTSIDPGTGMTFGAGNRIFAFTANTRKKEARAGFSGNLYYVLDEASGIPDDIIKIANTAPGARILMISNPTRNEGYFYDAFNDPGKQKIWCRMHVSSREAAKAQAKDPKRYPWLASNEWVNEQLTLEGVGSYFDAVRIEGDFPLVSDSVVIASGLVDAACARWTEGGFGSETGPVYIGVDPARFGADSTCIVWRRGQWVSEVSQFRGLRGDQIADKIREIARYARERTGYDGKIIVNIDASNANGVSDWLTGRTNPADKDHFTVNDICSSASSTNEKFLQKRCELWFDMRSYLYNGGKLPDDSALKSDLKAPKYSYSMNGRTRVESKDQIKSRIGRSTDRADAVSLSISRQTTRNDAGLTNLTGGSYRR